MSAIKVTERIKMKFHFILLKMELTQRLFKLAQLIQVQAQINVQQNKRKA